LQFGGASCEDLLINAYSKDLRMKALHAVDRATPRKKKEVVRTFGVSLAALKRWLKRRREGEEYLRAKPSPGRTPRILSTLQQRRALLTTTPGERRRYPRAPLPDVGRGWGVRVSVATMSRAVRKLAWSFKKDAGSHRARREGERCLARTLERDGAGRRQGSAGPAPATLASPDFNPIEEAFSKVKSIFKKAKARTPEALFEATHQALSAVSTEDARGFFSHCGYGKRQALPI
jgi:transposase